MRRSSGNLRLEADARVAIAYLSWIYAHCERLIDYPDRGTPRVGLVKGLRTVAFERSALIVDDRDIRIMRVLSKGRDFKINFAAGD